MARYRRRFKDNIKEKAKDIAERAASMPRDIYDMMRDEAARMGHAAAKLPNEAWKKYAEFSDNQTALRSAKLYMKDYMMGRLGPADFATMLAEDDKLRYTVSDLCRLRLDPPEVDIQPGTGYINIGAGLKTFWSEMKVPLPSEVNAARDLKNIYYGIEAGKAAAGAPRPQVEDAPDKKEAPEKRTLRDRLRDAKRDAAGKLIEKLTPVAEGDKSPKLDEKWLETEEGKIYAEKAKDWLAQNVGNMAAAVSAGKDPGLDEAERRKALAAAMEPPAEDGKTVTDEITGRRFYWPDIKSAEELDERQKNATEWMADAEKTADFLSQFKEFEGPYEELRSTGNGVLERGENESDTMYRMRQESFDAYANIRGLVDSEPYHEDVLEQMDPVQAAKLGIYAGNKEQMKRYAELQAQDILPETKDKPAPVRDGFQSGYSLEELNSPLANDLGPMFDQIMEHMSRDGYRKNPAESNTEKSEDKAVRRETRKNGKEYVVGDFEGQSASFNAIWNGHAFTSEEAEKLLAGETVSFGYEKDGKERTASGKLEWQEFNGRRYLGFKQEMAVKQENTVQAEDKGASVPPPDDMPDEWYAHAADGYFEEEEDYGLSEEDLAFMRGGDQSIGY